MVGEQGSVGGIATRDGVAALGLCVVGYLLHLRAVRWAWILAGVAGAISVRDLLIALGAAGVAPGPGLWSTAGGSSAAAVVLFARLFREVRRGGPSAEQGRRV